MGLERASCKRCIQWQSQSTSCNLEAFLFGQTQQRRFWESPYRPHELVRIWPELPPSTQTYVAVCNLFVKMLQTSSSCLQGKQAGVQIYFLGSFSHIPDTSRPLSKEMGGHQSQSLKIDFREGEIPVLKDSWQSTAYSFFLMLFFFLPSSVCSFCALSLWFSFQPRTCCPVSLSPRRASQPPALLRAGRMLSAGLCSSTCSSLSILPFAAFFSFLLPGCRAGSSTGLWKQGELQQQVLQKHQPSAWERCLS